MSPLVKALAKIEKLMSSLLESVDRPEDKLMLIQFAEKCLTELRSALESK